MPVPRPPAHVEKPVPRSLATRKEVAVYIVKPVQTLAVWAVQQKGPRFIKLENGSVRYRWEDVEQWLDQQATGGAA